MNESTPLKLAVVGAGPVGLALALHAARALPQPRSRCSTPGRSTRTSSATRARSRSRSAACSCSSVSAPGAPSGAADPRGARVAGAAVALGAARRRFGEPELRIRAIDEAVPMLGAVLSYGADRRAAAAGLARRRRRADPQRLISRFGTPVAALKNVDAPTASRSMPASPSASTSRSSPKAACSPSAAATRWSPASARPALRHDYGQTAWVGSATFDRRRRGRHRRRRLRALHPPRAGGAAAAEGRPRRRWSGACRADDDPVRELDDAQRVAVLNTIFHPRTPRLARCRR